MTVAQGGVGSVMVDRRGYGMGFIDEDSKFKEEKEEVTKIEQETAIRLVVTAAIAPLQREISSLKAEIQDLKGVAEKPSTAVMDEGTRKEIQGMMASAAAGIESYRFSIYALCGIAVILAGAILWNSHRLNEFAENMDWKYDVVTGILSGDRHYWWDGENYEASRKAPEAKRLQEAIDRFQKITEQMRK